MKFNCVHCGEVDHVIVDGYRYGERLLEGVSFEVRRDDEGKYSAQVNEAARDYFSQFNQKMYLSQIEEDMPTEEFAICPTCGDEVVINQGLPIKPNMAATLQSFADIIGAGSFAPAFTIGGFTVPVEPEIGDTEIVNEIETVVEPETPSCKGGDSGGGGASEDLGEPEEKPLEDQDEFEPDEPAEPDYDDEEDEEEDAEDEDEEEDA